MSVQIETLISRLQAERAHASQVWTILNELRIQGHLPEWAKALDAGTMRQADDMGRAQKAVNAALLELVPGLARVTGTARPTEAQGGAQ